MKTDDLFNFISRALAPLKTTIMLLTGRAIITQVDDSKSIQECQVTALAGETMGRVPRVQNFGFSSNPPLNSEGIIVSLGGVRENIVIVTADNRTVRFKNLASGESAVYTDDGTVIHLKKGGLVDVIAAAKVLVTCPEVEFTGNVKINGNLHTVGNVLVNGTVQGDTTINATIMVGAGAYSGPLAGGPPSPMITDVPIISSAAITTSADVTGGGTTMAALKAHANAHTHPETNNTSVGTGPAKTQV